MSITIHKAGRPVELGDIYSDVDEVVETAVMIQHDKQNGMRGEIPTDLAVALGVAHLIEGASIKVAIEGRAVPSYALQRYIEFDLLAEHDAKVSMRPWRPMKGASKTVRNLEIKTITVDYGDVRIVARA